MKCAGASMPSGSAPTSSSATTPTTPPSPARSPNTADCSSSCIRSNPRLGSTRVDGHGNLQPAYRFQTTPRRTMLAPARAPAQPAQVTRPHLPPALPQAGGLLGTPGPTQPHTLGHGAGRQRLPSKRGAPNSCRRRPHPGAGRTPATRAASVLADPVPTHLAGAMVRLSGAGSHPFPDPTRSLRALRAVRQHPPAGTRTV